MIYLDHAATSFPKPKGVLEAVVRWYEQLGVSAERGDSARCMEVRNEVDAARRGIAALAAASPSQVAFTSGATESLNLALRAMLRPGDTVLTTVFEHSSVVRPLRALQRERQLRLDVLPATVHGDLDLQTVAQALQTLRPRLFVFTHASNVTGALFDAAAMCDLSRRHGCLSLLDASQTAGLFDIDVGADIVVGSAHKSLHGPPGLGFLIAKPELELAAQKQGGTGSSAALDEHPTEWPTAFEAGTPNTPAILGLAAALRWLAAHGAHNLRDRSLARIEELSELLAQKPRLRLLPRPMSHTPVLSFVHAAFDAAEVGSMLAAAGVHVRTGFHCAPWIHRALCTEHSGTVRMSTGPLLTADDVRAAAAAVVD